MGDDGIILRIDEGSDGCEDGGADEFGWYLPRGMGLVHAQSVVGCG